MIPRDLSKRPGVGPSALLGDIYLKQGEVASARQIYLDAWALGEAEALVGFLATCSHQNITSTDLLDILDDVLERSIAATLPPQTTITVVRLIISILMWSLDDPSEGAAAALRALEVLPGLSFPLVSPRGSLLAHEHWQRALRGLWRQLEQTPEGPMRGYMVLKHHHLAACCPDPDIQRSEARLGWIGPGAEGAAWYLCLRALDVLVEWPTATKHWGEAIRPDRLAPLAEAQLHSTATTIFNRLLKGLADPGERQLYQRRLLEWQWALGELDDADAALDAALNAPPVEALSRNIEHVQRLSVVRSDWPRAAAAASLRAEQTSDEGLRSGLLLLALEYLRMAVEPDFESLRTITERLVIPEHGGGRYAQAVNRLGFEVLEGLAVEMEQRPELLDLWHASGSDRGEVEAGGLTRYPDRRVESVVLESIGDQTPAALATRAQGMPLLRRWLVVRALALASDATTADGKKALSWIQTAVGQGAATEGSERALWAAVALESAENTADALAWLESELVDYPSNGDLLLFHLWWDASRNQGDLYKVRLRLEPILLGRGPEQVAQIKAALAHDLLDEGSEDDALTVAREAFTLDPLASDVRDVLREAAEACDSDPDREMIREIVDDVELGRLLQEQPGVAERYMAIDWQLEGDAASKEAAMGALESLSVDVEDERLGAALLRRAAEVATELGQPDAAATLSQRAVSLRRTDMLALKVSLETMTREGRFAVAADLIIEADSPKLALPLAEATAVRLIEGGRGMEEANETNRAIALYRCGLGSLDRRELTGLFVDVIGHLERLYLGKGDVWAWRDLLEHLLTNGNVGSQVAGALHMRLGRIYQDQLPDPDLASEHFRLALAGAHSRSQALEALEKIYGDAERYAELAQVLRDLVAQARLDTSLEGIERRVAHQEALAQVLAERLGEYWEARELLSELLTVRPKNLDALLKAAELDRRLGEYEALVAGLEVASRLIEDQQQRSAMYFEIGEVYEHKLSNPTRALESYMVSFICNNSNTQTFSRLEQLYQQQGRWKELIGIFDVAADAVRRDPKCGYDLERLYSSKAQIEFMNLERPQQASLSFLNALRINPAQEKYVNLLEVIHQEHRIDERLIEAYRLRIEALQPSESARRPLMHKLADMLQKQGREDEVISVYRDILAEWPSDEAAERLETVYRESERFEELVQLYQERLASAGSADEVVPLHWAIAQVAERKLRDMDMAVQTYETLLELVPGNIEVLRALGRLLEATRRWDRLVEISEREVRLTESPKSKAHIYFRIGSLHETIHQDLEQAIRCYERAVSHDPRSAPALHGLREIYQRQERWDKVVDTFEREAALWTEPKERASIYTMMADIYIERIGEPESAELLLDEALAIYDGAQSAAERLLDLYISQERWLEADGMVGRLVTADSANTGPAQTRSILFYKQAIVASHLGRDLNAVASSRLALDLDPHNTQALEHLLTLMERSGAVSASDPEHLAFLVRLESQLVELENAEGQFRLEVHRGELAEARFNIHEALMHYRAAATKMTGRFEAHRPLMKLLIRLRRFEMLVEHLHSVLADAEEESVFHNEGSIALGRIYLDWLDRPTQALACFEKVLTFEEDNTEAQWLKAQAHVLCAQWSEGAKTMESLIARCEGTEDPNPQDRERLGEYHFYLGRIMDIGLGHTEQALVAYGRAKSLYRRDIRPVLGAAHLLTRTQNWLRLENLLRGSITSMEQEVSEEDAVPLRLFLAEAYEQQRDLRSAETEYQTITDRHRGPAAREAHLALARLYSSQQGGLDRAIKELHTILDDDPLQASALRQLSSIYAQRGQHDRIYNLYRVLEAFGQADGREMTWLAMRQSQLPPWLQPLGPMSAEAMALIDDELTEVPEIVGLHGVEVLVARLFPTGVGGTVVPHAQATDLYGLCSEAAQWLQVKDIMHRVRLVGGRLGPLKYLNADQGHGCVEVSVNPRKPAERGFRFALIKALDELRRGLVPCRAAEPRQSALLVELLVRLQEGEALEGLRRETHLRGLVRRMNQADVGLLKGAVESMNALELAKPVSEEGEPLRRLRGLLAAVDQASERVALVADGDIAACIDVVCASPDGVMTRSGEQRVELWKHSPRVRDLVRFYISERYFAVKSTLSAIGPISGSNR